MFSFFRKNFYFIYRFTRNSMLDYSYIGCQTR
nr:MAG TPA: hypothetical protein [Caudoviricetes sp.]